MFKFQKNPALKKSYFYFFYFIAQTVNFSSKKVFVNMKVEWWIFRQKRRFETIVTKLQGAFFTNVENLQKV